MDLAPLRLHDVVVAPDGERCVILDVGVLFITDVVEVRLLGVATMEASPHGLQPSKSRKEKRIIGKNLIVFFFFDSSWPDLTFNHIVYNFISHETEK